MYAGPQGLHQGTSARGLQSNSARRRRRSTGSGPTKMISVAIPARNAAATIAEQLLAVLGQQGVDEFEVVVADNGSTDATVSTVAAIAQQDDRLRLIDASAECGEPGTRNVAAASCEGTSIAFCDADDVVRPGWLAAIQNAFNQGAHGVNVVREQWLLNPELQRIGVPQYRMNNWLAGGAFAVTRDLYRELGGFDVTLPYGADTEFGFRLRAHVGRDLYRARGAVVSVRLPKDFRATFTRARRLARVRPELRRRHPDEFPLGHLWSMRAEQATWLVRNIPLLTGRSRLRWAEACGSAVGEVEGTLR